MTETYIIAHSHGAHQIMRCYIANPELLKAKFLTLIASVFDIGLMHFANTLKQSQGSFKRKPDYGHETFNSMLKNQCQRRTYEFSLL